MPNAILSKCNSYHSYTTSVWYHGLPSFSFLFFSFYSFFLTWQITETQTENKFLRISKRESQHFHKFILILTQPDYSHILFSTQIKSTYNFLLCLKTSIYFLFSRRT